MSDRRSSRPRTSIEISRCSSAPATTLFRIATDGATWSKWAKPLVLQSEWEAEGIPPPGGLGAVRRVGIWPMLGREKTVAYEQDRRHVYALIGGAPSPARDYQGEVNFSPRIGGGTDVCWRASFRTPTRGTGLLVATMMRFFIWYFTIRLIRAAENERP